MPVAMFFFTIMFTFNVLMPYDFLKAEHGIEALDVFVGLYLHYFFRTFWFTFLVSLYGFIFLIKKLKYHQMILLHAFVTIASVVVIFRHPDDPGYVTWIVLGSGIVIYGIIWFFIKFKERQFLKDANKILNENKMNKEKPE
jgi:hypothetical protein